LLPKNFAKGIKPRPVPNPIKDAKDINDKYNDLSESAKYWLCLANINPSVTCMPKNLLKCMILHCSPKCSKEYDVNLTKETFVRDPSTPCVCTKVRGNPDFDEPLPGLGP
jgi:hypothetical protein